MNFLQKPVGVAENEESIMAFFKRTAVYNEINDYQVNKCLHDWWEVNTLTIGGYVHSTSMLCHFDYGKCDLIVLSPTVSFRNSLDLRKDTQYSQDFDYSFDRVLMLFEPVKENDIVDYLEKRYSMTGRLSIKKHGDKILVMQRNDSPAKEWNECAYSNFCIAEVKDGTIKMITLSPSPMLEEYCGF